MPDTSKPYAYIEMEIDRLKYEEGKANRESKDKRLQAETLMMARMERESALDKQKKADAERASI